MVYGKNIIHLCIEQHEVVLEQLNADCRADIEIVQCAFRSRTGQITDIVTRIEIKELTPAASQMTGIEILSETEIEKIGVHLQIR